MIGSHLCEALLGAGHRVVCLDNLSTGRVENVKPLAKHRGFELVVHDISTPLPALPHLDRIYDLASPASMETIVLLTADPDALGWAIRVIPAARRDLETGMTLAA